MNIFESKKATIQIGILVEILFLCKKKGEYDYATTDITI